MTTRDTASLAAKERDRALLWALMLILTIVIVWGSTALRLRRLHEEQVRSTIVAVLESTEAAADAWSEHALRNTQVWSTAGPISELIEELAPLDPNSTNARLLQDRLHDLLAPVMGETGYEHYYVINPIGLTLASSEPSILGTIDLPITTSPINEIRHGEATIGAPQTYVHTSALGVAEDHSILFMGAPVIGPDGYPIASLIFMVDAAELLRELFGTGRIGQTGETYAFSDDGLMLSPSRFQSSPDDWANCQWCRGPSPTDGASDTHQIELRTPDGELTLPVRTASSNILTNVTGYEDYRGATVAGAWVWNPRLGFGIATEIDKAEIFSTEQAAQLSLATGTAIFFVMIIAWLFVRRRQATLLAASTGELSQAYDDMSDLNRELNRSNQDLDRFAYVASHDLKAPLRNIDNLSQWVLEDSAEALSEESGRHLALIRDRVTRMNALLDGLLEYSRVGRKVAQNEEFDPIDALRDAAEMVNTPTGFTISLPSAAPPINTPRHPFELVMRNLLSNAVKYRESDDGRVDVLIDEGPAFLTVTVSDDGPGIPLDKQETVFEVFTRLHSNEKVEGSGIGLALVRRTVESFGGEIVLTSTPGEGATFTFTWPKEWINRPKREHE